MSYASEILADSPSGHWRLGEASGTSAADASGNALTGSYDPNSAGSWTGGTLGTTPPLVGDANTAATFNGTSGRVKVKTGRIISGLTNATIEAWVKTTTLAPPTSGGQAIYCERGSAGNDIFKLAFDDGTNDDKLQLIYRDTAGTLNRVNGSTALATATWYHVACVKSGTAVTIYVNGVAAGTGTLTATNTFTEATTQSWIGGDLADPNVYWSGGLDEVAVYTSALSAARILAHYNAGLGIGSTYRRIDRNYPRGVCRGMTTGLA